ncbi:chaplin family protein [Streptomyces microflavus]|uniref:chaplin family protein n=1 Tax=Streptomyces microflavus TaxID=1919 RepID=UPI003822767D
MAVAAGTALAGATPASAGGISDFLSPAFGTNCSNLHTGAHGNGETTRGSGSVNGNLAGLPVASPLNQCGGADLDPSSGEDGHISPE